MSALIHFVRHAVYDRFGTYLAGRSEGVGLSMEGVQQAKRIAPLLQGRPIDALFSSPQQRTRETAAAIGSAASLPVNIDAGLDEIDFGAWCGRSFEVLSADADWHVWNSARSIARTPGGETMRQMQMRVLDVVDRLRDQDVCAVLVSHADVIKAALLYHLGLSLDRYDVIDVAPASVSTLEIGPGHVRILRLSAVA